MNPDLNSSIDNMELKEPAGNGKLSSEASSFVTSETDLQLGAGETIVAQLRVIPSFVGALEIVGVRWKLSGSVSGFCKFDPDLFKKKVARGRRKLRKSSLNYLKFIVIKNLPKLEGILHHISDTVFAGDMRCLSLELKNPSNIPLKNLKMKVSNPRFLKVGDQDNTQMEFPSCLEKGGSFTGGQVTRKNNKASPAVFLFPKVLPSLDLSFQISHCPSRLQEFLVRMDIINRKTSEQFKVHQLYLLLEMTGKSHCFNQWTLYFHLMI